MPQNLIISIEFQEPIDARRVKRTETFLESLGGVKLFGQTWHLIDEAPPAGIHGLLLNELEEQDRSLVASCGIGSFQNLATDQARVLANWHLPRGANRDKPIP